MHPVALAVAVSPGRTHADRVDEVREAGPDDLELSLVWDEDDEGGLVGHVRARNITATPVRLSGKPGPRPLGEDGAPLATDTLVTAEFRSPGYAETGPGEQASAPVGWAGWMVRPPVAKSRFSFRAATSSLQRQVRSNPLARVRRRTCGLRGSA
jgi:Protein of unknown function (DUF4232)